MLGFDLFTRVIDEAGVTLARVDFFNYGEAFLHKRSVEMCEYIKRRWPHIYQYTSTNGLAFAEALARLLVHTGIDEVTFSLDGAIPENYLKYLRRWNFEVALRNLAAMADERQSSGCDVSFLNWRYILSSGTTRMKKWISPDSVPRNLALTASPGRSQTIRRAPSLDDSRLGAQTWPP